MVLIGTVLISRELQHPPCQSIYSTLLYRTRYDRTDFGMSAAQLAKYTAFDTWLESIQLFCSAYHR